MAGYSSFTVLRKIQNEEKYRKAHFRHELQKKKEKFLDGALGGLSGYNFPELSEHEMEVVKGGIKANLKQEEMKSRVNSLIIFILTSIAILYAMIYCANEIEQRVNFQQVL